MRADEQTNGRTRRRLKLIHTYMNWNAPKKNLMLFFFKSLICIDRYINVKEKREDPFCLGKFGGRDVRESLNETPIQLYLILILCNYLGRSISVLKVQ